MHKRIESWVNRWISILPVHFFVTIGSVGQENQSEDIHWTFNTLGWRFRHHIFLGPPEFSLTKKWNTEDMSAGEMNSFLTSSLTSPFLLVYIYYNRLSPSLQSYSVDSQSCSSNMSSVQLWPLLGSYFPAAVLTAGSLKQSGTCQNPRVSIDTTSNFKSCSPALCCNTGLVRYQIKYLTTLPLCLIWPSNSAVGQRSRGPQSRRLRFVCCWLRSQMS